MVRYADRVAVALESITPLPRHALKAEFDKGGFEAVREYRRKNVIPSAGPYRVTEFVVDDHVFLEANPHFAGPAPSIARIEIKRYADDAALVGAFESGPSHDSCQAIGTEPRARARRPRSRCARTLRSADFGTGSSPPRSGERTCPPPPWHSPTGCARGLRRRRRSIPV